MTDAPSTPAKSRLIPLIRLMAAIAVIGFIPLDDLLSIEIRNETAYTMVNGGIGLGALFLCLSFIMILLMRRNKWYSGLVLLLFPVVLLAICGIWLIGELMGTTMWKQESVYRCGDDYLVLEGILLGRDDMTMDYRIFRTRSPYGSVRHINDLQTIESNSDRFYADRVIYYGKTWDKIASEDQFADE